VRRQVAVFAHLERAVGDRAEPHPLQPHHRVADGVAHVAHLPRAPLVQRDRDQRLVLACAQAAVDQPHGGRRRPPAPDRHAAPQPLERALVGHAAHPRVVLALDLVARVQQSRCQLAVVGEQQQAFRVVVEPAHRVDVLPDLGQQVEHRRPALRVLPRRHVAARLVEEEIPVARRHAHALAVDADVVVRRIGPRAELEDGDPVHRHAAVEDQRFRRAPRGDAGGGEDLLQTNPESRVPSPVHRQFLSRLAKKSTSSQTSRVSCSEFSSACVMMRLSSVRVRVRPSR